MATKGNGKSPGMKARFWEEMKVFGILSLYLFVCFSVLLMYEASVSGGEQPTTVHFGVALVQALVIGKFLLIGKVMGVGKRVTAGNLVRRVAMRTVAFILILIVFKILEELIVGWFHDENTAQVWADFAAKSFLEVAAPILVMTLLLIPLAAFVELQRAIGEERLARIISGKV